MFFTRLFAILLLATSVLPLTGCKGAWKSAPDFNKISVGMTKAEVLEKIGKPTHVSALEGKEMLIYEWDNFWDGKGAGMFSYVALNEGKVYGYYTDHLRPSGNYNLAEAWTRIQSAPRTNITAQQNNMVIQQSQTNYFR
jgi:hypothetical protein